MANDAHKPIKFPAKCRIPWEFCARCGLMYLRNAATARAVKAKCPAGKDDPQGA